MGKKNKIALVKKNKNALVKKNKIALVRGRFLNQYEMQLFKPLVSEFNIVGFGSLKPFHDKFDFPVIKLPSPVDLPEFPYKMPVLNRFFVDAHYLFGLEERLRGFDLVHSAETYFHYTKQCLNAKKKGYVKKVIATVYENIPFNNEGIWGRKSFKKRAREELDHIIAISKHAQKALLLEGADSRKITVIGHGIDTAVFQPSPKFNPSASLRAGVKSSKLNILFVGRLEICKGVYEVLETAKILLNDKKLNQYKITFTMVGNGSEKRRLIELERKLGIEKFVSHKELSYNKMPQEYQKADIFIAPSKAAKYWQEQYNIALLEAQASGLPIITTSSGSIAENVGDAAIVVKPGDFYSLSEAIKTFILNPKLRFEYSQKARKRAIKVHDVRILAKKISNLYRELLK